jgi:hypothetical protein
MRDAAIPRHNIGYGDLRRFKPSSGGGQMPLNLFSNIYTSGSVPEGWAPLRGKTLKYPVRNRAVLRELKRLQRGRWRKVITQGNLGDVHYFEHESGHVAGVKFFRMGTR